VTHKNLALQSALESMVLLKNEGNVLPLSKEISSITVLGQDAAEARFGGYSGSGNDKISVLQGIKNAAGKNVFVNYSLGCSRVDTAFIVVPSSSFSCIINGEKCSGLKGEYFNNVNFSGQPVFLRCDPQINFQWTLYSPDQEKLGSDFYSVRWTGKLKAKETGEFKIGIDGNDGYHLFIDGNLLIDNSLKCTRKTTLKSWAFEKGREYDIRIEYSEPNGNAWFRLVWNMGIVNKQDEEITKAVKLAAGSDIAIIVAGIEEGEFRDRAYLNLPGRQEELIKKIESNQFEIRPEKYKKEILSFLTKEKLKDISISRKNVKWGIPLPFDQEHTTYVWFDAFLSYLTGIGWDGDTNFFQSSAFPSASTADSSKPSFLNFWPADLQLIGKDILRVHATIWPIMLMHLGIELPKMIYVHGHLLAGGRKMSKTIGNVISIEEMLEKFGAEAARYLLMSAGTFGEDVDVTMERMIEKYNADLANGLGNLVSRVMKLAKNYDGSSTPVKGDRGNLIKLFEKMELNQALEEIWKIVREDDKFVEVNKPWELVKTDKAKFSKVMEKLVSDLFLISELLVPFMQETADKIKKALEEKKTGVLFPRIK